MSQNKINVIVIFKIYFIFKMSSLGFVFIIFSYLRYNDIKLQCLLHNNVTMFMSLRILTRINNMYFPEKIINNAIFRMLYFYFTMLQIT